MTEDYEGIILMVTGSRRHNDWGLIRSVLDMFVQDYGHPNLVIHGDANGADTFAQIWAQNNHLPIRKYPAEWHIHGKKAGPMRNTEMVNVATHCYAFPLEDSKGTWDAVKKAKEKGIIVQVIE